ncbi:rod shape-determining protein MreC [Granulicella tundricola]|uniref:Cell shape-determining protein MreC n=1 Tax=Granulicella tundricola (strain ATCC BAA-1859 / DSM 23138 / MP5ACTX9) TaxID=1198114 RepID=E8X1N8_GRATM|nr:rod shape-determining protein MreC [Granulicella tundricola]ADW67957.1 rod shape-determining protein MreC [Granulicella tundricola MP5ACTX9]
MESFFSRFKNPLALIVILLVQAVALGVQIHRPTDQASPDGSQVRLLRLWALSIMSPFERVSTGTGHGVRGAWSNYLDLRHVRQNNQDLRQEIANLRLQRAALAEDALEGQRLQSLLGFQQHYVSKTVAAQVIGTSGTDQSRVLTLDKGAQDGLKPDMAVITPDGIVGKLRDVFPHTSQLLLVSDPTSGAGVILQATRIRAILHGSPQGRIQINNLTIDSRIKPGEVVLTSGGDQVFPRGLPVGKVESMVPDPEHQPYALITLKPAANLNQLEEVLVITGISPTLGAQTQEELAAEAAARAADTSAERLPGLKADKPEADPTKPVDPNAPAENAPPPSDNAPGLVPKPKPVVHADRFTYGSPAAAADLTPGAPKSDAVPVPHETAPKADVPAKPKAAPKSDAAKPEAPKPEQEIPQ